MKVTKVTSSSSENHGKCPVKTSNDSWVLTCIDSAHPLLRACKGELTAFTIYLLAREDYSIPRAPSLGCQGTPFKISSSLHLSFPSCESSWASHSLVTDSHAIPTQNQNCIYINLKRNHNKVHNSLTNRISIMYTQYLSM